MWILDHSLAYGAEGKRGCGQRKGSEMRTPLYHADPGLYFQSLWLSAVRHKSEQSSGRDESPEPNSTRIIGAPRRALSPVSCALYRSAQNIVRFGDFHACEIYARQPPSLNPWKQFKNQLNRIIKRCQEEEGKNGGGKDWFLWVETCFSRSWHPSKRAPLLYICCSTLEPNKHECNYSELTLIVLFALVWMQYLFVIISTESYFLMALHEIIWLLNIFFQRWGL